MNDCFALGPDGPSGIAETLRAVDCATTQATAATFGRLFGANGAFLVALTIILTLYIAFVAISLLTGRSSLSLSALTPRITLLGLVLTFATSWGAYQSVVWNLATGAPDEIASALTGSKGSATMLFADRFDTLFTAITNAAVASNPAILGAGSGASVEQLNASIMAEGMAGGGNHGREHDAASGAAGADGKPAIQMPSMATPSNILWLSALLLLLGTAGVLIVSRIALAALLALGPVFIVLALFKTTRGLFEGWLKATSLFAFTPLLTVLIGSGVLAILGPLTQSLTNAGGAPSMHLVFTIFLIACVYAALMTISLRTATLLTNSWRLPSDDIPAPQAAMQSSFVEPRHAALNDASSGQFAAEPDRVRDVVHAVGARGRSNGPELILAAPVNSKLLLRGSQQSGAAEARTPRLAASANGPRRSTSALEKLP